MEVKFLDMKREANYLLNEQCLAADIVNVIASGTYLFGENHSRLEASMSDMIDAEVILVGSGTDAIVLSLIAAGVCRGDKVILPALSAIPTAVAAKMVGADIVYVDVDDNGSMDICEVEKIVKSQCIKAVLPVHLYGQPVDMHALLKVCVGKTMVIEDCAQSFGSKIGRQYAGTFGVAGALSFYPSKNLGGYGDAGAVITKDSSIANKIRELRFYGQKSSYVMGDNPGMNSRVDEIQCAILLKKMNTIWVRLGARVKMVQEYTNGLKNNSDIKCVNWAKGAVPHLFPIRVKNRKDFQRSMGSSGIQTAIHYPFTLPAAVDKDYINIYPKAKEWSETVVSIPFNPWLTVEEQNYIIEKVSGYIS